MLKQVLLTCNLLPSFLTFTRALAPNSLGRETSSRQPVQFWLFHITIFNRHFLPNQFFIFQSCRFLCLPFCIELARFSLPFTSLILYLRFRLRKLFSQSRNWTFTSVLCLIFDRHCLMLLQLHQLLFQTSNLLNEFRSSFVIVFFFCLFMVCM